MDEYVGQGESLVPPYICVSVCLTLRCKRLEAPAPNISAAAAAAAASSAADPAPGIGAPNHS